jgi:hypothetical protein
MTCGACCSVGPTCHAHTPRDRERGSRPSTSGAGSRGRRRGGLGRPAGRRSDDEWRWWSDRRLARVHGSIGSTNHGRWQLGRVRGGRRRERSRGIEKRSIAGAVVDDDGGEVVGSIHGPGRISEQPWLDQRWPLAPWPRATPSAADMVSVAV